MYMSAILSIDASDTMSNDMTTWLSMYVLCLYNNSEDRAFGSNLYYKPKNS